MDNCFVLPSDIRVAAVALRAHSKSELLLLSLPLLEEEEMRKRAEEATQERAAMPQVRVRDGETLCTGWLYKGSFNLSHDTAVVKEQLNRLKPWNKRWFVLCGDGRLYYYRSTLPKPKPKH